MRYFGGHFKKYQFMLCCFSLCLDFNWGLTKWSLACCYLQSQLFSVICNITIYPRYWILGSPRTSWYHVVRRRRPDENVEEEAVVYLSILVKVVPAKILSPFLCTAPCQYVPKILFTQATIDCLTDNKSKNTLHKETVILNCVLVVTQLTIAWVINHL